MLALEVRMDKRQCSHPTVSKIEMAFYVLFKCCQLARPPQGYRKGADLKSTVEACRWYSSCGVNLTLRWGHYPGTVARSNQIENRNLVSNHPPHTINSLMAGRVKKERLNTLKYLNIQDDLSKERRGMCGLQGLGEILCEVRSFPRTFTIIHLREPIDMLLYCLVWKLHQSGARRHRAERSPWPNPSLAVSCPMYRNCTTTSDSGRPGGSSRTQVPVSASWLGLDLWLMSWRFSIRFSQGFTFTSKWLKKLLESQVLMRNSADNCRLYAAIYW